MSDLSTSWNLSSSRRRNKASCIHEQTQTHTHSLSWRKESTGNVLVHLAWKAGSSSGHGCWNRIPFRSYLLLKLYHNAGRVLALIYNKKITENKRKCGPCIHYQPMSGLVVALSARERRKCSLRSSISSPLTRTSVSTKHPLTSTAVTLSVSNGGPVRLSPSKRTNKASCTNEQNLSLSQKITENKRKCGPCIHYQPMVWTTLGAVSSGTEEALATLVHQLSSSLDEASTHVYGCYSVYVSNGGPHVRTSSYWNPGDCRDDQGWRDG